MLNYARNAMAEDDIHSAEIEVTDALFRHARLLSQTKDPRKKIAAARWELKLAEELDQLRAGKEEPAHA